MHMKPETMSSDSQVLFDFELDNNSQWSESWLPATMSILVPVPGNSTEFCDLPSSKMCILTPASSDDVVQRAEFSSAAVSVLLSLASRPSPAAPAPSLASPQQGKPSARRATEQAPSAGIPIAVQAPAAGAGQTTAAEHPDVHDVLAYLDSIKAQFTNEPGVYDQFMETLKQFKMEQIDTPTVIKRVLELFEGHPQLILGFNAFLPAGFHITCSSTFTATIPGGVPITHTAQTC